jgi:two-component system, sensor histidine kinase and response regulator
MSLTVRPDPVGAPACVKCLVVDDRPENVMALAALLRRDDVEVLEAHSGAEALELLLAHDVALALLDVQMPEMDGFELAELMRGSERTRDVPIIFVTAGTRDQQRVFKGYDRGAVDFLYKPVEPHVLRNKAAVFFELYQQKQQILRELHERTEALRLNQMFAAVLGHDLRTPLGAILTSARVIEAASQDQVVRASAARMISSGERMSRMIDDLLDMARARLAGGLVVRPAPADLGALALRVVREHQAAFPDRALELTRSGDLAGEWDGDRFTQLASNLVGNALEHGSPGEPVDVRVDGSAADTVVFSVENRGTIAPEMLPYVFEAFQRPQPDGGRPQGLGLGLYIAQEIARAHDGRIAVASDEGRTVFRVTLPRKPRSS